MRPIPHITLIHKMLIRCLNLLQWYILSSPAVSFQVFKAIISGALNELKELLGDAVTLVIETIEKHINCFFVQALQLDPKTLRLEAQ
jgi:hypothetical protein